MSPPRYRVLFLCTGNSARSVLAEALLRHWGRGRFETYSAGSQPSGQINPCAIEYLQSRGLDTDGLRSESWDVYAMENAPPLDFVITVCDSAAGEACPLFPGPGIRGHWGVPDPADVGDTHAERMQAFAAAAARLEPAIRVLAELPDAVLGGDEIKARLSELAPARL